MGRAPCCDKASVKKGPWSPEEDARLKSYIEQHGTGGNWIALPQKIGLKRCGKSCRLRWLNYLRPNIKHGGFSEEEDRIILSLYISIGSRWSIIAAQLPGRTDNDIKNYWNTKLKKRLFGKQSRRDQRQHQLKQEANTDANGRNGVAGVTARRGAGVSYWHQQQQAMSMQVHPVSGPTVDGSRVGDDVDESIRKLLLKLGGSPFAAMAPACAPLPPPMYDDAPTFVAPSVHAASLAEGAVQCPRALPALELDECFHFNQVKLDGLDCFFGMAGGGVVMAEQSAAPAGHVHKWSEVSPLVCPSMLATSQGMHPYSLIEEPVNLVMQ